MRGTWRLVLGAGLALAVWGCERESEPTTGGRDVCVDAGAEAEARMAACSALIDSGALPVTERALIFANRGDATYAAGDVTAALRDYNAALEIDAHETRATKGKATILIESGQLDAAEPLVTRLIDSGAFTAEAHYLAGNIALLRHDVAAAEAAYGRSIEADQGFALSYANRGVLKQSQRDYPAAMADFDAALAINPQLPRALSGRCWTRVLLEEEDISAARADADAAVAADPRNVQGQLCRGLLQLRVGEWANARASYEAALALEPGNPAALFGRGVARRRSGDRDGRDDMNQARDFDPHIARRFEDLGVETY